MDDGSKDGSGFVLHTNNFTVDEVKDLIRVLKDKFDLDCTLRTIGPRIYIRARSIAKFKQLVTPYFIPCMMYKLL
jgi:hypothetical protein